MTPFAIVVQEPPEFLQDYRNRMDLAVKELAILLGDMNVRKTPTRDDEILRFSVRKLWILYNVAKDALTPDALDYMMNNQ